jgi:two-component sensor histidine kinase
MLNLNSKSKVLVNIALHALVWGFLFAAPIIFAFNRPPSNEPPREAISYFLIWVPMSFSLLLFYLNYFILINNLLFKKKLLWFFLTNIILITVFSYCSDLLAHFFQPMPMNKRFPQPPNGFVFGLHNFSFMFVISISVAIRTTSRWFKTETERKILENENLKSKLSNLKMQLNPHFFFNTLNNIYSLIKVSPEKAQESVHGLAKLMRYHLYETNEETVPLSEEVEFLKNYIALMKIRMTPNVTIETDFTIDNPTTRIAPLLFISLVENSFKHGVSPIENSFIKITMVEHDQILAFEIFNTDYHQKTEGIEETGIGLENLRKRLALIYPEKHNFVYGYESKHFQVKVILQL